MIEFHGWAVIRESFKEDENEESLFSKFNEIESRISELNGGNEVYILKWLNGTAHLSIMVDHNHRTEHVIDFFKWVASIAIGSYGLLYVYDDEDIERGNQDKFKVWRMKKGKVEELDDPFLSPINPVIEE